ncbi:NifU family protein [Candidatus Parcubacteria bacterium]|nr:MAG: NifU family protein [Candidatus Parcubacteria bacterium]
MAHNPKELEQKIKTELEKLRPSLQMDGGDVEFVHFNVETGVLQVRMLGGCAHCPMAQITLKQGIEAAIKQAIPEVQEVINV